MGCCPSPDAVRTQASGSNEMFRWPAGRRASTRPPLRDALAADYRPNCTMTPFDADKPPGTGLQHEVLGETGEHVDGERQRHLEVERRRRRRAGHGEPARLEARVDRAALRAQQRIQRDRQGHTVPERVAEAEREGAQCVRGMADRLRCEQVLRRRARQRHGQHGRAVHAVARRAEAAGERRETAPRRGSRTWHCRPAASARRRTNRPRRGRRGRRSCGRRRATRATGSRQCPARPDSRR